MYTLASFAAFALLVYLAWCFVGLFRAGRFGSSLRQGVLAVVGLLIVMEIAPYLRQGAGDQSTKTAPAPAYITIEDENTACRKDLSCWGEKAWTVATLYCTDQIERFANHDFEWTDGFLGAKFSHYRWKNKPLGIVTVLGDKIKFQNGFGGWTYMTYACDVNPATKSISDVNVVEGRL